MNLCVDQGNSAVKLGVFEGDQLIFSIQHTELQPGWLSDILKDYPVQHCIVSSTAVLPLFFQKEVHDHQISFTELTELTPLPFTNTYKTPQTLGKDRLAAVAGASALMPAQDVLVIDAGTAITFDFIDASGVYHGGNIAPGLELRAKALHAFTHRLPFVDVYPTGQFLGNDTVSAINSGIVYGALFEIDGYIDSLLLKYPKLSVFLTGGSSFFFDNKLKNRTFAVKNLVLTGLNRILNFNVQ